jgi:hypothetical protein
VKDITYRYRQVTRMIHEEIAEEIWAAHNHPSPTRFFCHARKHNDCVGKTIAALSRCGTVSDGWLSRVDGGSLALLRFLVWLSLHIGGPLARWFSGR